MGFAQQQKKNFGTDLIHTCKFKRTSEQQNTTNQTYISRVK